MRKKISTEKAGEKKPGEGMASDREALRDFTTCSCFANSFAKAKKIKNRSNKSLTQRKNARPRKSKNNKRGNERDRRDEKRIAMQPAHLDAAIDQHHHSYLAGVTPGREAPIVACRGVSGSSSMLSGSSYVRTCFSSPASSSSTSGLVSRMNCLKEPP